MEDFKKDAAIDGTMAVRGSKEYELTLEHGTDVKFLFSVVAENYSPNDFHELLDEFSRHSRAFYLAFGREITD